MYQLRLPYLFLSTALAVGACDANADTPAAVPRFPIASASEPQPTAERSGKTKADTSLSKSTNFKSPNRGVGAPQPWPVAAASLRNDYPWLEQMDADLMVVPLVERYSPPKGYQRVAVTHGSPGHAVVVLDVAQNDTGERVALLGQGFMPAQDFHVIRDHGQGVKNGVWFVLPEVGEKLDTPSWRPFSRSQARRFE